LLILRKTQGEDIDKTIVSERYNKEEMRLICS